MLHETSLVNLQHPNEALNPIAYSYICFLFRC